MAGPKPKPLESAVADAFDVPVAVLSGEIAVLADRVAPRADRRTATVSMEIRVKDGATTVIAVGDVVDFNAELAPGRRVRDVVDPGDFVPFTGA